MICTINLQFHIIVDLNLIGPGIITPLLFDLIHKQPEFHAAVNFPQKSESQRQRGL